MPKKILMIFWGHPLFDGRCINMMNQLLNKNYIVHVVGVSSELDTISYKGATIEFIDASMLINKWTKYLKYFNFVKKMITIQKPDVIIASDLYSMIPSAQTKSQHNAKIIYDSRELYTQLGGLKNKPLIQKVWTWYEKKYILVLLLYVYSLNKGLHYVSKEHTHRTLCINIYNGM